MHIVATFFTRHSFGVSSAGAFGVAPGKRRVPPGVAKIANNQELSKRAESKSSRARKETPPLFGKAAY
jgi:hypothetical protein